MVHFGLAGMIGMPGFFELLIIAVVIGVPACLAVVAIVSASNRKNRQFGSGNLVPCPDCHSAVSIRAQSCPHCGAPLKPPLKPMA